MQGCCIHDHQLRLDSRFVTEVHDDLIPTGAAVNFLGVAVVSRVNRNTSTLVLHAFALFDRCDTLWKF